MSHGAIPGDEGSVWYVDVSVPMDEIELTRPESIKLRLEELEEIASDPSSLKPETVASLSEERNRFKDEHNAKWMPLPSRCRRLISELVRGLLCRQRRLRRSNSSPSGLPFRR